MAWLIHYTRSRKLWLMVLDDRWRGSYAVMLRWGSWPYAKCAQHGGAASLSNDHETIQRCDKGVRGRRGSSCESDKVWPGGRRRLVMTAVEVKAAALVESAETDSERARQL